jgi:hypothetical protein
MKKRVIAAMLGVVIAGAVTAVAAEPALADNTCGNGLGCTWTGSNWNGNKLTYSFSGFGGLNKCSQVTQNVLSSFQTFGNPVGAMVIYKSSNCSGSGSNVFFMNFGADNEFTNAFGMHSAKLVSA